MSIDLSVIFIVCLICLPFFAGILLIIRGWYTRRQAFSRPPGKPRRSDTKLWQQLLTWQVINPGYPDPAILEEFSRSKDFIESSAMIGAGLAAVLVVAGGSAISLVATGTLLSLSVGLGYLLTAGLLLAGSIGYSLGYVYGVWQLRSFTAGKVAYADLQQRRLSDYRSFVFPWMAGILTGCAILTPLLLTPYLGSKVPLLSVSEYPINVPGWVLEGIPAAMLLTLITGEMVSARVARLPRLLLTSNPQIAQRADNLLRALTICTLQGLELAVLGYLAFAQWFIIVGYLGQLNVSPEVRQPSIIFSIPEALLAWAVGLIGLLLRISDGRIGGRISGWPWRQMKVTP